MVERLKFSHKDEVDRLQLELLRAKGVGTNVPQTRMLGDNDATSVVGDDVARGLPQEPSTPFISGGFDSPAVASPEARGDQSRGPTHIHSVDARVRDIPAMASPEVRSDQSRGSTQDRGVGAGMMLSPQTLEEALLLVATVKSLVTTSMRHLLQQQSSYSSSSI